MAPLKKKNNLFGPNRTTCPEPHASMSNSTKQQNIPGQDDETWAFTASKVFLKGQVGPQCSACT